jgi:hypothetical protein
VELHEIREGLVRWSAPHPEWEPGAEPGSPADWPELVGSTCYDTGDVAVFIDPLVPDGGWDDVDELVDGRPVVVLTTVAWHERSRAGFVERYGAVLDPQPPPDSVEARPVTLGAETEYWLPAERALVVGDRILGDDDGGLRVCPESWLDYLGAGVTHAQLADALRPPLELPIEIVLVSHGAPVLEDGHAALERALSV